MVITPYHRNRKELDKMSVNYKRNLSKTEMCRMYHNMYDRCYSPAYHERSPQYKDCEICPEWLDDKNNFYDWVLENYYTIDREQIDLDKDILVKGNKIYSPDTCIFAPHSINTYFENLTREPVYLQKLNKYRMDIWVENRNVNIITDAGGKKLVLINDIRFRAKVRDDWKYLYDILAIKKETSSPLE